MSFCVDHFADGAQIEGQMRAHFGDPTAGAQWRWTANGPRFPAS